MNQTKAIPAGYHSITPYLIVNDAVNAIAYYKKAFGATEFLQLTMPNGKIAYAELRIGDSAIMLADEFPEMGFISPSTLGGTAVSIHLYVENADIVFEQAITAGGKSKRALSDQFFGDRSGTLVDPFGHVWTVATRKENVSPEEIHLRFKEMFK